MSRVGVVAYAQRERKGGAMVQRCLQIGFLLTLASLMVLAGCAKMMTTTSDSSAPGAGGSVEGGRAGDGSRTEDGGGTAAMGQAPGSPARPDPREFTVTAVLRDIHFEFDRYDIRPEDARVLEANAESLKSNPSWRVLIEGHADQRGTSEYNLALGDRRAKASMNYLVSQGVRASRISVIRYREAGPVCQPKWERCWGEDRAAPFPLKEKRI